MDEGRSLLFSGVLTERRWFQTGEDYNLHPPQASVSQLRSIFRECRLNMRP